MSTTATLISIMVVHEGLCSVDCIKKQRETELLAGLYLTYGLARLTECLLQSLISFRAQFAGAYSAKLVRVDPRSPAT